jgi:hypothetical protein
MLIKGTYLKDLLTKNHLAQIARIYINMFEQSAKASLLKSILSFGEECGHNKDFVLRFQNR